MADYNAVMAQLDAQAQQAAQQRMAEMIKAGQVINMGVGEDGKPSYYYAGGDQARVEPHNLLADALVYGMMDYIKANPNDPVAQQMQADLWENQKNAHKGDFGSFLHGAAVSGALGGALGGFGAPGMGLGESLAAQGGLIPADVMGPPAGLAPDVFVGPQQTPGSLPPDFMGPPGGLAPAEFMGPAQPAVPPMTPQTPAVTPDPLLPGAATQGGASLFTPEQIAQASGEAGKAAGAGVASGVGGAGAVPAAAEVAGLGGLANAAGAVGAAATATGSTLGNWLRSKGLDISDDALKLMGSGASTLLGLYGADKQASTLKDLADREMSIRQPFIDATKSMMADPGSYYASAPAMGATDAVLRRLSVNGNPAGNPSDLAKAAAYNLGGYNESLRTLGGLALGSAGTTVNLGRDIAAAEGSGLNAIGTTIADLTNPKEDTFAKIDRLLRMSRQPGSV